MTILQKERAKRNWSQAELARQSRLHPSQVSLFESRRLRPYPGQLEKLAAALEWPASEASALLEEADGILAPA